MLLGVGISCTISAIRDGGHKAVRMQCSVFTSGICWDALCDASILGGNGVFYFASN